MNKHAEPEVSKATGSFRVGQIGVESWLFYLLALRSQTNYLASANPSIICKMESMMTNSRTVMRTE